MEKIDLRGRCIFIVSCARSGSTSLGKIFSQAFNVECAIEPQPNLDVESRQVFNGQLVDKKHLVLSAIAPRVKEKLKTHSIYCEKNLTYAPFIRELYKLLKCKFVFIKRDGRDVVTSLMNWHEQRFGNIYRECRDPGNLSNIAMSAANSNNSFNDTADYARPRPSPSDPYYDVWSTLSRFEMCCYYWAFINQKYRKQFATLPQKQYTVIDYTHPRAEDILKVAEFCGIPDVNSELVAQLLEKKINSLEDRQAPKGRFPIWQNWDSHLRSQFEALAGKEMKALGLFRGEPTDWKPQEFGADHSGATVSPSWHTESFKSNLKAHQDLIHWVKEKEEGSDPIKSIIEVGCGIGLGYPEAFSGKDYFGIDLSELNIAWCKSHHFNPKHQYFAFDIIADGWAQKADLVFSNGAIDHTYNVEAFIKSIVNHSTCWIYLVMNRGWFPSRDRHKYSWNSGHRHFYNEYCPQKIKKLLKDLGCQQVTVEAVESGNPPPKNFFETLVIAKVR